MSEAEEVKNVEGEEGEAPSPTEDEAAKEEGRENDENKDAEDQEKDGEEKDEEGEDKGDLEKENHDKEVANKAEPNEKNLKDMEKQEEAKLRAKYPDMKSHGASSFLQKRLSKGNKYFDSGDYNMAKAKVGSTKPLIGPGQKVVLPGPTGDAIPTPETVPHKKISNLQSKLVNLSWATCRGKSKKLRTRPKHCRVKRGEKIAWKSVSLAITTDETVEFSH